MSAVFESLKAISLPSIHISAPIVLSESVSSSRCKPLSLTTRDDRKHFALKLGDSHWLPILAELPKESGVRKLPDYLVFLDPKDEDPLALPRILVSELKSSATGATSATRQVQLGALLVEYLIKLAWMHANLRRDDFKKSAWVCGLVVSEDIPSGIATPKGGTRPGKMELPSQFDKLSGVKIYYTKGGGEFVFSQLFE